LPSPSVASFLCLFPKKTSRRLSTPFDTCISRFFLAARLKRYGVVHPNCCPPLVTGPLTKTLALLLRQNRGQGFFTNRISRHSPPADFSTFLTQPPLWSQRTWLRQSVLFAPPPGTNTASFAALGGHVHGRRLATGPASPCPLQFSQNFTVLWGRRRFAAPKRSISA